jgi:RNA polymerase sigma-70 factor (ECF subfamily)
LLEAFRGFDQFRGPTTPELIAWLRQILVRNLADQVRCQRAEKRDQRREISLDDAIDRSSQQIAAALHSPVSSPSAHLSKEEQSIVLADALERLPKEYRDVIILRHFERLSFKQIADKLDRSPGAVRMLFARAIDRLRQELMES